MITPRRTIALLLHAATTLVFAAACDPLAGPTTAPRVQKAADACGMGDNVGDGGNTVSFDTEGEDDTSGDDLIDVACVLVELGAPEYVLSRIDSTRALDGMQDAEWDGLQASWTYHPDDGLRLVVHD